MAANSLQKQAEQVGGCRANAERAQRAGIPGGTREAMQPRREFHVIPT
jgi:hypothetical protein